MPSQSVPNHKPTVYVSPGFGGPLFSSKGWKAYALIAFIAIFGGWGVYALYTSFAASPTLTKVWSTAADWKSGVLANTVVSGNSVRLATAGGSGSGGTTTGPGMGSGGGSGNGNATGGSNPSIVLNNSGQSLSADGGTWTVSGGVVYKGGVKAGFTANVLEIALVNNVIWQESNSHLWWSWSNNNPSHWTSGANPLTGGSNSGSTGGGSGGGTYGGCTQTLPKNGFTAYNGFDIQTNEWSSSKPFAICNSNHGPNFQVTQSQIAQSGGAPGAYPSIFIGCHWGTCTSNDPLGVPVSSMETNGHSTGKVTTSYTTYTTGSGAWDDSYDIWFNSTNNHGAANNSGLEMMVWIASRGGVSPAGGQVASNVSIGGNTYNVWDKGSGSGATVSFVLTNPTAKVSNLDLGSLAAYMISKRYMPNGWYLNDVEAGFEVWNGGTGLTANNLSVTVNGATTAFNPGQGVLLASNTVSSCGSTPIALNNSGQSLSADGGTWTVSGGVVYKGGAKAGFSKNVLEIADVNDVIWQENSSHLWWSWNGKGWNGGNGITTSPIVENSTCSRFPIALNNSGQSLSADGGTWTVSGGVVYKGGAKAGFSKNVLEIADVNDVIWQENSSHLWWSWNGKGWNGGNGIAKSPIPTTGGGSTQLTGTLTLTFNAGKQSQWISLAQQATIPAGAAVTTAVRTSNNDANWSGWSTDPTTATHSQYLQIRVSLTANDAKNTPTLSKLTLTYTPDQSNGGGGGGGGGGTGGFTIGNSAPPSGTNAIVDFRSKLNVPALNEYSIGDTLSTYGVPNDYVGNATWRNELAALGPLAWRVPLRDTNGTPTGAGGGGGGTGYVQDIRLMHGVPVVIASGQNGDDDFNNNQIRALVKYYNDNGGQNGGPVTSWIVGNEPESGSGGGWGGYVNNLPGVVNAMESADPNTPIKIAAGTVWDQGDISLLSQIAGDRNISYLTWHAYQAADSNGNNSGQYAGPLYESEEQQAASIASAHGEQSGIEEFNWNSGCNNNKYAEFNQPKNAIFIASVIGNVLAGGGAHAYMYADSNGCGTLAASGNNNEPEYMQLPAYWALGMWTGMNGEFDRFGGNLVDTKVNNVDITSASGREGAGLQHEVELFATNNGKILAINKNTSANETISIGVGGLTNGKYNVWQSSGNPGTAGKPREVVAGASFSGSTISITLPAGTISSIDLSN